MSIKSELLKLPWIEHIDQCNVIGGKIIYLKAGWRFSVDDSTYKVASTWDEAAWIAGHEDEVYRL